LKPPFKAKLLLAFTFLFVSVTALFPQSQEKASFERAQGIFKEGISYFNKYSYLGAAEYFRKAVSVYPSHYRAREYLARSYRLAGYTDEALNEWEILYTASANPSVKAKIDAIRYRKASFSSAETLDFTEASRINSGQSGRFRFPYPCDIAVDVNKRIYVTSYTGGKVVRFGPSGGQLIHTVSHTAKIYGIDVRGGDVIYSDFANNNVYLADENLKTRLKIGQKGSKDGSFYGPQGVVFDDRGYFYVVDSGNNRVQKFTPEGRFLLKFGRGGAYEGEMSNPTDIAIHRNRLFISDTGNHRVVAFDTSGNYLSAINDPLITAPRGLSVNGDMLVISDERSGILLYQISSESIQQFSKWKDGDESFSRTYGGIFDREGTFYALDHGRETIYAFTPTRNMYTNLDVEIASIDIAKYPVIAIYLNVRDRTGAPVYGLDADQFTILEDKARIRRPTVSYLSSRDRTATIVLAVDRSEAMRQYSGDLEWVTDFIFTKMKKNDRVKIVNYDDDYYTSMPYDWSRLRALKSIREGDYSGGADLGRVLYNGVADIIATESKRAVVLVSSGEGYFSAYSQQKVIDYAMAHFVPVYIVSFSRQNEDLRVIAEKTGGSYIHVTDRKSLGALYDEINKKEEYRYALVYQSLRPKNYTDWWSEISIEVVNRGQRGMEWGGYYVP